MVSPVSVGPVIPSGQVTKLVSGPPFLFGNSGIALPSSPSPQPPQYGSASRCAGITITNDIPPSAVDQVSHPTTRSGVGHGRHRLVAAGALLWVRFADLLTWPVIPVVGRTHMLHTNDTLQAKDSSLGTG